MELSGRALASHRQDPWAVPSTAENNSNQSNKKKKTSFLRYRVQAGCCWLMPESKLLRRQIRRVAVQSQPRQIVLETLS
jgi:hypothetical protein